MQIRLSGWLDWWEKQEANCPPMSGAAHPLEIWVDGRLREPCICSMYLLDRWGRKEELLPAPGINSIRNSLTHRRDPMPGMN